MNNNFIYIKDNFLSKKECEEIIKQFKNNLEEGPIHTGYLFKKLLLNNHVFDENFLIKFNKKFNKQLDIYKKTYPEINETASYWGLNDLTFKKFNKGKFFSNFHSEHSLSHPNRLLSVQLYLTEHGCGTEFYKTKEVILSKIGRLAIFPAYFTHTHKGQKCPENKERFIITGYVSFINFGPNETHNSR